MQSHVERLRKGLPESLRAELLRARKQKGWSQAELGRQAGLPQVHVWGIETGKTTPRVDTLLNLLRLLDREMIVVPRPLVPTVQALVRDHSKLRVSEDEEGDDLPRYQLDDESPEPEA